MALEVFPFKPRDWVVDDSERVARVIRVYEGSPGEVLLDLSLYSHNGDRVGRTSPAYGGPRTFEPACSAERWRRIAEPRFPIRLQWVPDGEGRVTMRYFAGERLPPASWKPPKRKARGLPEFRDDRLRQALEAIADGHNDARGLASDVLGRKR